MYNIGDYVSVSIDRLGRSMKDYDLTIVHIDYSTVRIISIDREPYLNRYIFEFSDDVKLDTYGYNIDRYATAEEISKYVCEIRKLKLEKLTSI